jgi:hypothetical protein
MNEIMQSEDSFYEFKLIQILLALISLCVTFTPMCDTHVYRHTRLRNFKNLRAGTFGGTQNLETLLTD